jgi:ABC transporter substrate binding protein
MGMMPRVPALPRMHETKRVHRASRRYHSRMAKLSSRGLEREGLASWYSSTQRNRTSVEGVRTGSGQLGYVRGKNIILVDQISAPGSQDIENAIASLVPNIDLLIVVGTVGGVAARKLVTTKPVVFISVGAPVEIGSLSRPGRNMTGIHL